MTKITNCTSEYRIFEKIDNKNCTSKYKPQKRYSCILFDYWYDLSEFVDAYGHAAITIFDDKNKEVKPTHKYHYL